MGFYCPTEEAVLQSMNQGDLWIDPDFPPDARALFPNPLQPPPGNQARPGPAHVCDVTTLPVPNSPLKLPLCKNAWSALPCAESERWEIGCEIVGCEWNEGNE